MIDRGPLRIVMLGPFGLEPKGTMLARALPAARALAQRGHAVLVAMPPWHTPDRAPSTWEDAGVRVTYTPLPGRRVPLLGHGLITAELLQAARAFQPDVVHAFKPKAYSGLGAAAYRLAQNWGWPGALVVDTDDWEGRGGWNELEPYSPIQKAVFRRQESWGLAHADVVTVASRTLETLAWAQGARRDRVVYLPNALDDAGLAAVGPVSSPPVDGGPVLILYTRFFEFDLAWPLAVLAEVRTTMPQARLTLAGAGLFGEEEHFRRLAAERGLLPFIEQTGWLTPENARDVFSRGHIGLYPMADSLVNRTKSPAKLLQVMAAELPVVASAVGEVAEVVQHGVSGLLSAPGDTAAAAGHVAELWADSERRRAMGRAARRRITDAYAWSQLVIRLETAYRDALASRRLGGGRRSPTKGRGPADQ